MERLQKALELARKERAIALGLRSVSDSQRAPAPEGNAARDLHTFEAPPEIPVAPPPEYGRFDPAATQSVELTGRFLSTRELQVDHSHLRRSRLLGPGMQGVAAVSFKMLRTQVMQRLRAKRWNSLAIVSATPEDGKTMTAINLAMAISMDSGHSALLVDFDLRRPSVARRLGIPADPGVEDCLNGSRSISEVFVRLTGYDRLMILPAGNPVIHSSELLASESTRRVVYELKSRYTDRIVLFDLPPLLGADDALAFMPEVDAALLVVGEGHTREEHLRRALELLRDTPIIGTVLNRSRSDSQAYHTPY